MQNSKPSFFKRFFSKDNSVNINSLVVAFIALGIGLFATYWSFSHGVILAYGDAEAHLNIARRVTDSLTPGFSQIGGVWLPFPHLAMLPFVWNKFLWQTGLAGSIVSVFAFVWANVILYRMAYLLTKNQTSSLLAPLVFATNPNAIYLATTPLSEIVLFSTVTSSIYFLAKWVYTGNFRVLILAAFFTFLATLSRYDAWLLVIIEFLIVTLVSFLRGRSLKRVEGNSIMFGVLAFLGISLWLLWNQLIFGNFLYFANSIYGSKAQQMWFYLRGYLPTYHNLPLSVLYYAGDTLLVNGIIIIVLGSVGLLFYLIASLTFWRKNYNPRNLIFFILLFSFLFYTVSLFTGQASLIMPLFAKPWYKWTLSNVRYGVQMLIPLSIFIAYLSKPLKLGKLLIVILILLQSYLFLSTGDVIVYKDGVSGLSSQAISKGPDAPPVENWIMKNYNGGKILMDDYRRPISPVSAHITLNNFVSVGNKPLWQQSLNNPSKYVEWIILQKADTDAVWTNLNSKSALDDNYANVFRSGNIWVYKKRNIGKKFVHRQSQNLTYNGSVFEMKGVNIYDLLSLPKNDIENLLSNCETNGINTVRFWAFNKSGRIDAKDFDKFDFIITESQKKGIYLIPVLANQWADYGGISTTFYTGQSDMDTFEAQVKAIVLHTNNISTRTYNNEYAILTWELINEPRVENDNEAKTLIAWTQKIGSFILNMDNNHMISIGTEGFIDGTSNSPYKENHGANLNKICSLPVIDMCSVHLYPKYFKTLPIDKDVESLITEWQSVTNYFNKPLYIGEVGFNLSEDKKKVPEKEREQFFSNVKQVIQRKKISGGILWGLGAQSDKTFTLSFDDPKDKIILTNWAK